MPFSLADIRCAILKAQNDLERLRHSSSEFLTEQDENPKILYEATRTLTCFFAGYGFDEKESYNYFYESSFEDFLINFRQLAEDCVGSQKEAIRFITREIIKQSREMRAEVDSGKRKQTSYLPPLEFNNQWGNAVLALKEAFKVPL